MPFIVPQLKAVRALETTVGVTIEETDTPLAVPVLVTGWVVKYEYSSLLNANIWATS